AAICAICLDYGFRPVVTALPVCPIPHGSGLVMDPRLGNARALYDQTRHERRLMGGYIARIPGWVYQTYRADPALGWFFQREDRRGEPPVRRSLLPAMERSDVAWVCVSVYSLDRRVLQEAGLRLMFEDETDAFFAVPSPEGPPPRASPAHLPSGPS